MSPSEEGRVDEFFCPLNTVLALPIQTLSSVGFNEQTNCLSRYTLASLSTALMWNCCLNFDFVEIEWKRVVIERTPPSCWTFWQRDRVDSTGIAFPETTRSMGQGRGTPFAVTSGWAVTNYGMMVFYTNPLLLTLSVELLPEKKLSVKLWCILEQPGLAVWDRPLSAEQQGNFNWTNWSK